MAPQTKSSPRQPRVLLGDLQHVLAAYKPGLTSKTSETGNTYLSLQPSPIICASGPIQWAPNVEHNIPTLTLLVSTDDARNAQNALDKYVGPLLDHTVLWTPLKPFNDDLVAISFQLPKDVTWVVCTKLVTEDTARKCSPFELERGHLAEAQFRINPFRYTDKDGVLKVGVHFQLQQVIQELEVSDITAPAVTDGSGRRFKLIEEISDTKIRGDIGGAYGQVMSAKVGSFKPAVMPFDPPFNGGSQRPDRQQLNGYGVRG
jgi:hypothetical protein